MQAIKEKISDLKEIRKVKAEAKEVEKTEKEVAKSRREVAHEVKMAKEAEAAMDFHVQKAAEKAAEHEHKFPHTGQSGGSQPHDSHASAPPGYSPSSASGQDTAFYDASTNPPGATNYNAAPTSHNNLL